MALGFLALYRALYTYLLPTRSEERGVLGVGSTVAVRGWELLHYFPSCHVKTIAL